MVARATRGEACLEMGTAMTLLTEAIASATEAEVIMREKENIART